MFDFLKLGSAIKSREQAERDKFVAEYGELAREIHRGKSPSNDRVIAVLAAVGATVQQLEDDVQALDRIDTFERRMAKIPEIKAEFKAASDELAAAKKSYEDAEKRVRLAHEVYGQKSHVEGIARNNWPGELLTLKREHPLLFPGDDVKPRYRVNPHEGRINVGYDGPGAPYPPKLDVPVRKSSSEIIPGQAAV